MFTRNVLVPTVRPQASLPISPNHFLIYKIGIVSNGFPSEIFHSFYRYLLGTSHTLDIVLGSRDIVINKTKSLPLWSLFLYGMGDEIQIKNYLYPYKQIQVTTDFLKDLFIRES